MEYFNKVINNLKQEKKNIYKIFVIKYLKRRTKEVLIQSFCMKLQVFFPYIHRPTAAAVKAAN